MTDRAYLVEPYQDAAQEHEAAQLGMWVFLATEVMLFSGLFMGILVFRVAYEAVAREASDHLHLCSPPPPSGSSSSGSRATSTGPSTVRA